MGPFERACNSSAYMLAISYTLMKILNVYTQFQYPELQFNQLPEGTDLEDGIPRFPILALILKCGLDFIFGRGYQSDSLWQLIWGSVLVADDYGLLDLVVLGIKTHQHCSGDWLSPECLVSSPHLIRQFAIDARVLEVGLSLLF